MWLRASAPSAGSGALLMSHSIAWSMRNTSRVSSPNFTCGGEGGEGSVFGIDVEDVRGREMG